MLKLTDIGDLILVEDVDSVNVENRNISKENTGFSFFPDSGEFLIYSKVNKIAILLGLYDGFLKDDDSAPTSIEDAKEYLYSLFLLGEVIPNYDELVQWLDNPEGLERIDKIGDRTGDVFRGAYFASSIIDRYLSFNCNTSQEWFYNLRIRFPQGTQSSRSILRKGHLAGTNNDDLGISTTSGAEVLRFYARIDDAFTIIAEFSIISLIGDGLFHDLIFSKVGNIITVGINGSVDTLTTSGVIRDSTNLVELGIGVFDTTTGAFDYSIVDTDCAYYDFEYINGSTVLDQSGNSNNATINGAIDGAIVEDIDIRSSRNERGYSVENAIYIPENKNNEGFDINGSALEFKGRVAYTATYDDVALTTTQPLSPQLREIEETYFTTRIWYDTSGNATPFANPVESSDYEDAHVFFRKLNEDGTFESFVYATPLSGDDLTDMQLYCGIIEAYQVTEGAYQVAEGDYFVTP